ncbi:MAG: hypothetical protein VW450_03780 [Chloroflexota bacterium]
MSTGSTTSAGVQPVDTGHEGALYGDPAAIATSRPTCPRTTLSILSDRGPEHAQDDEHKSYGNGNQNESSSRGGDDNSSRGGNGGQDNGNPSGNGRGGRD